MTEKVWIVAGKEIRDNIRDRRTLAAALVYPLLGPLMIMLIVFAVSRVTQEQEEPLRLPVSGAEHAPNLLQFLEQNGVETLPALEDPEQDVRNGEHDVVLVVPDSFAEEFSAGRPAVLQLILDESRRSAIPSIRRARSLLEAYSNLIGRLRLQLRGVDPSLIDALAIENLDVSTPQSQAANFLNMAPYFIIFSIFIGGMYLAIDSTAGERERGSLEPLLINPVSRAELVLAKITATLLFTGIAVLETVLGFALVLNFFPLEHYIGVRMSLPPGSLLMIFLLTIPVMILAVALQVIIASSTKSFKEAQNYITFLTFIPAIPALFLAIVPVKVRLWTMLIPTVGQQLLINQIMRAEPVKALHIAASVCSTTLLGLFTIYLAIRLYQREKLLFQ